MLNCKEKFEVFFLFLIICFGASWPSNILVTRIAGPVEVIFKKIEKCPKKMAGENGFKFSELKYFNPRDKPWDFVFSANISLEFYLDENIVADWSMTQWSQNGGWKMGVLNMRFPQMCWNLATWAAKIWDPFITQVYGKFQPCPLPPGPVDIVLKRIAMCPKKISGENGLKFSNIKSFNSKDKPWEFILTANVSLRFYLDDNIMAVYNMAQWSNRGGWKVGVHNIRFRQACSSANTFIKNIIEPFVTQVYGEFQHCPFPPVEHAYVRNVTFNTKTVPLKDFVYGRWRSDVLLIDSTTRVTKGCLRAYADLAPAKTMSESY